MCGLEAFLANCMGAVQVTLLSAVAMSTFIFKPYLYCSFLLHCLER